MLKLENVRKNYDRFTLECSLEVQPGCITGLVGQNGAGKSTTFKAILGLIHTDGGRITLMGKDAAALTAADKERLGVVLSNSGVSEYLTVRDTAAMLKGFYHAFDRADFLEKCGQEDQRIFHRHEGEAEASHCHQPQGRFPSAG